jgi:hypothetical protein
MTERVLEKRHGRVPKAPEGFCGFFFLDVIFQALQEGGNGSRLAELGQSDTSLNEMVLLQCGKQRVNNTRKGKAT